MEKLWHKFILKKDWRLGCQSFDCPELGMDQCLHGCYTRRLKWNEIEEGEGMSVNIMEHL